MPSQTEIDAAAKALWIFVDKAGYGAFVTLAQCRKAAVEMIQAVDRARIDAHNQLELTFGKN